MNVLPTIWETTTLQELNPPEVQYGFVFDLKDLAYGVYITNFKNLWVQNLIRQDIIKEATKIGLDDLQDDGVKELLKLLRDSSDELSKLRFKLVEHHINVELKTNEIKWKFHLSQQSTDICSEFMVKFCKQLLAVNKFSNYKINELSGIIKIKDVYSKFLTENFKLSHGMDLINKFKRNNKSAADQFEPFSDFRWNKKLETSYSKESSTSSSKNFWEVLNQSIHDKTSWKFSNELLVDEPPNGKPTPTTESVSNFVPSSLPSQFETIDMDTIPDLKFSDDPFFRTSSPIKEEEDEEEVEETTHTMKPAPQLKKTDLDEDESQIASSLSSSPTKRGSPKKRAFGSFGSRKRLKRQSPYNPG